MFRIKQRTMYVVVMLCVACIGLACNSHNSPSKTTITLWHFWSEPRQKQALTALINQFEKLHPTIHVELTDLQWSDGKTKLLLGFNAHTAPDVVHLGFEWMPGFDESAGSGIVIGLDLGYHLAITEGPWEANTVTVGYNPKVSPTGIYANFHLGFGGWNRN